jgi:hypothetical protein
MSWIGPSEAKGVPYFKRIEVVEFLVTFNLPIYSGLVEIL